MSFGPGDQTNNNFAFSGGSTFWTNWTNNTAASASLARTTAIACKWCAHTASTTTTGHNDIWRSNDLIRAAYTNDFGVGVVSGGQYSNVATGTFWIQNQSFYGGFWRTASQSSRVTFPNGALGGYSGKSGDDGDIGGGTNNWAGFASIPNPGGMGWFCTAVNCNVYVKRGAGWSQANVYVRRSGGWTQTTVWVNRGGGANWTIANWLQESGNHIPEKGMKVLVDVGEGREDGWIVEGNVGWFGLVDPTALGLKDWTKTGFYTEFKETFTGRYNSEELPEIVDRRLYAYDKWTQLLKSGDLDELAHWEGLWSTCDAVYEEAVELVMA